MVIVVIIMTIFCPAVMINILSPRTIDISGSNNLYKRLLVRNGILNKLLQKCKLYAGYIACIAVEISSRKE